MPPRLSCCPGAQSCHVLARSHSPLFFGTIRLVDSLACLCVQRGAHGRPAERRARADLLPCGHRRVAPRAAGYNCCSKFRLTSSGADGGAPACACSEVRVGGNLSGEPGSPCCHRDTAASLTEPLFAPHGKTTISS